MRWVAKAAVQRAFSHIPAGDRLNYVFQRHVTGNIPMDDASFMMHARAAIGHFRALRAALPTRPPAAVRIYEFGAGWDLISGIVFWGLGINAQTLVDIRPNLRLELVNHTLATYSRLRGALAADAGRELRPAEGGPVASFPELAERFGITYLAPRDARRTGLPAQSVDLASSTFTLEHIPAADIEPMLSEAKRLLRRGGIVSCSIDMMDHYSYFDPGLGRHAFLRYSDRAWRLVNPPLHYQNRLRAPDYVKAFEAAGLEIIDAVIEPPKLHEREALAAMRLAPRFQDYELDELGARTMNVVARTPGTGLNRD
jgi:hypothetical protein